jgi:FKBP-type peptidyl-prolyl cis-trans isomerase
MNNQLTFDQMFLLTQALGIAETFYSNTHETIIKSSVNVRNLEQDEREKQKQNAKFYHEMACKMAELNEFINSEEFLHQPKQSKKFQVKILEHGITVRTYYIEASNILEADKIADELSQSELRKNEYSIEQLQ